MSGGLPQLPDTSRAVFSKRTLLKTLRSLRRSVSASHAEAQDPVIIPVNTVIPKPNEGSKLSFHTGHHHTVLENDEDN